MPDNKTVISLGGNRKDYDSKDGLITSATNPTTTSTSSTKKIDATKLNPQPLTQINETNLADHLSKPEEMKAPPKPEPKNTASLSILGSMADETKPMPSITSDESFTLPTEGAPIASEKAPSTLTQSPKYDLKKKKVKSNNKSNNFRAGRKLNLKKHAKKFDVFTVSMFILTSLLLVGTTMLLIQVSTSRDDDKEVNGNEKVEVSQQKLNELVSNNLTGGEDTIATKSRENYDKEIPYAWLEQNFASYADALDGSECINLLICGPLADIDGDNLTNLTEYNFGTDPNSKDTDGDNIADGDELLIYYTNPKMVDSDGDKINDNVELLVCSDPTGLDTRISKEKLNQIKDNISLYTLSVKTSRYLLNNGATYDDVNSLGYISKECEKEQIQPEDILPAVDEAEPLDAEETSTGENL